MALANFGTYQQINFQVPWNILSDTSADIELRQGDVSAWITQSDFKISAPGVFTINGAAGAIQHSNYSLVSASNPAQPGEVVIVYATGLGPVSAPIQTGALASTSPLAFATQQVSVSVAGQSAKVLYARAGPRRAWRVSAEYSTSAKPRFRGAGHDGLLATGNRREATLFRAAAVSASKCRSENSDPLSPSTWS